MKEKNNKVTKIYDTIHEIESSYNNISCVLSSYNIKQVIRPYLLSEDISEEDIDRKLDSFLSNIWQSNIALNDELISILTKYHENYLGFEEFILQDFINFTLKEDINKLVELRYIGTNKGRKEVPISNSQSFKNLVCNFNGKELFKWQKKQRAEHTPDDILEYYYTFFQLTMLVILYNIVSYGSFVTVQFAECEMFYFDDEGNLTEITRKDINLDEFLKLFNQVISLSITTGMEAYAEYQLDCNAGELIEEIKQLSPINKRELGISVNDEKEAITIRVKNSFLLNEGFIKEGYFRTTKEYDKTLDRKSQSTFRITRGSDSSRILFTVKITGMRTISRLLSINATPINKVYSWTMFNSGAVSVGHILGFFFRSVVNRCKNKKIINKSYYTAFAKFLSSYKSEQRSVPLKTALVFLLARKSSEERMAIIDKYLDEKKCSKQRTELRKGLKIFERLIQEDDKSSMIIDRFINTLKVYYAW